MNIAAQYRRATLSEPILGSVPMAG